MRDHSQIDLKLIWKRKVSVANHVSSIRLSADWQILWSLSVEIFARSNNRRRYNSNVVSWAKGPRYRPNGIQSGESRGAVEYITPSVLSSEQFCGKSLCHVKIKRNFIRKENTLFLFRLYKYKTLPNSSRDRTRVSLYKLFTFGHLFSHYPPLPCRRTWPLLRFWNILW